LIAWRGGDAVDENTISMPYPDYRPEIAVFFMLVQQEAWRIADYSDRPA